MTRILQFNEFSEGYTFDTMREVGLLKEVQRYSMQEEVTSKAKESLNNLMNHRRPIEDLRFTVLCEYVIYLKSFKAYEPCLFDNLYNFIDEDKDRVVDVVILKNI